tara:strand:+ start:424 stop:1299 length:876 start_codon:yes stop_codon:yes gene_type:complete
MATPNIVPRANNEGELGTTSKAWAKSTVGTSAQVGTNAAQNLVLQAGRITFTPSTGDTVTLAAATNGALSIATDDAAADNADLDLLIDGNITYNSSSGVHEFKHASTTLGAIKGNFSQFNTIEYVRVLGYTSGTASTNVFGPDISQGSTSHIWADSLFADGGAVQVSSPDKAIQAAQLVAGRGGYINNIHGWISGTNGKTATFRVFKATPTDDGAGTLAMTELGQANGVDVALDGTGESTRVDYNSVASSDLGSTATFSANDLIVVGLQSDSAGMVSRFALTMEVVYTEII